MSVALDLRAGRLDPTGRSSTPTPFIARCLNLVTNAIDAAGGKAYPRYVISIPIVMARPRDHQEKYSFAPALIPAIGWIIDVIDNGPGVAPEDREKIFSLFESRKGMRGTGLGLPVSAKILREHGGDIQVFDSTEGPGTCFRMRLPADGTSLSEISHRDTMI